MLCLIGGTKVDFIILNHSIYSKNEYGRILAEITFPEHREGVYCIESTHVVDEYIGTEVPSVPYDMWCFDGVCLMTCGTSTEYIRWLS